MRWKIRQKQLRRIGAGWRSVAPRNLYELFGTTGAKFAFDAATLGKAVDLIERTIEDLEGQLKS
jgi:hypothetical protein